MSDQTSRRVLAINANLTTNQYDDYLAELRAQGVLPLFGLPGNILLVERVSDDFDAQRLSQPTTVHHLDQHQRLIPPVSRQQSWGASPKAVRGLPLSADALGRLDQSLTQLTSNRGLGLRIATRFLQRPAMPAAQVLHKDLAEPVAPALADEIQRLSQKSARAQSPQEHQRLNQKASWLNNRLTSMVHRSAQDDKKAKRRTTLLFFFPESVGVGNENWTEAEVDDELLKATTSLAALIRVAPPRMALFYQLVVLGHGDPKNHITHEPSNVVEERLWINELLVNLGLDDVDADESHFANSKIVEAYLVERFGAAYATNVFVVRDEVAPFATSDFSTKTGWPHAYGNGYFVNNSRFAKGVYVHEYLHTTNAADQYAGSNGDTPCVNRLSTGHERAVELGAPLDQTNGNHVECDAHATKVQTIMRSGVINNPGQTQHRPVMDWYVRAAIGWGHTSQVMASVQINDAILPPSGSTSLGYRPVPYAGVNTAVAYQRDFIEVRAFRYMSVSETYYTSYRRCFTNTHLDHAIWGPSGVALGELYACQEGDYHTMMAPNIGYAELDLASPASFSHHEGFVQEQIQTYDRHDGVELDCELAPSWYDGYFASPLALSYDMLCFVRDIPAHKRGFVSANAYYIEHHPSCPQGTYDGANCYFGAAAAGTTPFILDGKLYTTPLMSPTCSLGVYDGANCYLGTAPAGTTPFIYDGKLYTTTLPGPTCLLGVYDGANCHVGTPAMGTSPFLLGDQLYTTASMSPSCPLGVYDGANCYVGTSTADTSPFLLGNKLYTTSTLGCDIGIYNATGCYMGSPPFGRYAYADDRHFYYSPF